MNGASLAYAELGSGTSIFLLHGGYANGDYWSTQALVLSRHHRVIVMDSRGQGRSASGDRPFTYALFARDVIGLADAVGIERFGVAGWSDGGIVALQLALHYPDRVTRVFTLGANASPAGLDPAGGYCPVFAQYRERAAEEYADLTPSAASFAALRTRMRHLGNGKPDWSEAELATIGIPVVVGIGDHDEVIRREHAEMLASVIPGAELLVVPATSHFAVIQAPALVTAALEDFFDRH